MAGKVLVFGMLGRKERISVEVVPEVKPRTLLSPTTQKARWESSVYTDRFRTDDAFMPGGTINHEVRFGQGRGCLHQRHRGLPEFRQRAPVEIPRHLAPDLSLSTSRR